MHVCFHIDKENTTISLEIISQLWIKYWKLILPTIEQLELELETTSMHKGVFCSLREYHDS